ncbi:MAG: monovalent cation:proton antiporter-2 (CPA2) family protein [Rickettsiales bacterium]
MDNNYLFTSFIFLLAACIVVPVASRFRLGSVLGYLAAGVLIGPFGIGLIQNPMQVMHFAEFGVVMMLFVIGLELEPEMLWKLRRAIIGLGGLQMMLTSAAFTGLGVALGHDWRVSLACSMALAPSSTALVLQMLQEKGLMRTNAGESSFAVLLLQDIAVIPILIILPLLAAAGTDIPATHNDVLKDLPGWAHALAVAGVIAGIVLAGRYVSHHLFKFIAKANLREVFTATSLALIVGITLLMQAVGVSPALGAFIAGVVLANSQYKHTIETDIEPFKGLLLGLFFISVGMGMNFDLVAAQPVSLFGALVALILVKMLVLIGLSRLFDLRGAQAVLLAFALAQGGEFAFVLFQFAGSLHVIAAAQADFLTLVVALSMATTPFLMIINDKFVQPRFMSLLPTREYDEVKDEGSAVIIAGYGRFGQIIGRFLAGQGVHVTILEKDPDQIELLRKFGNRGFFGDAGRLDVLQSAGAANAKLLIVAVDDADKALEIVRLAKREFPKLAVFARARNRRHAYELHKAGVDYYRRETFDSSLTMAQEAMVRLGARPIDMRYKARKFRQHDERSLIKSFEFFDEQPVLIDFSRQASQEMERILQEDIHIETPAEKRSRIAKGEKLPETLIH